MYKLLSLFHLIRNMGYKYTLYRFNYELSRRLGFIKKKYPTNNFDLSICANYDAWIKSKYFDREKIQNKISTRFGLISSLKSEVENILVGKFLFFSSRWFYLGNGYDWISNPLTNYKYDINAHWTEIEDFTREAGDIKFVWEQSRFNFVYPLIRYDARSNEDHSLFIISQILDWIEKNPLNCGPNYKCSQEISLRVLNWIFVLAFYKNSKNLDKKTFKLITNSIYWQIDHVYKNINFSRIAVRNNHAITETLTLYLVGLLFPEYPKASVWKKKGKQWFETEIAYQIAKDGTYLQFSMNYHRVVVQLLTLAISVSERHGETFSNVVYDRAYQSVNFLFQCQDDKTGWLPNYGANDGALFFKLNDMEYRDYRPQLDALHYLLTGQNLYSENYEDRIWFYRTEIERKLYPPIKKKMGCVSFDIGGYYIIRDVDTFSFIRCGKYVTRPSHADNLHIDIWINGNNVLCDGGSFLYNTDSSISRYFAGTESHNTVMLGEYDQMLKGPRFIWYYWTQAIACKFVETEGEYVFQGEVKCFTYIDKRIRHRRLIKKCKNKMQWIIRDEILNKPHLLSMRQIWHTNNSKMHFYSKSKLYSKNCFVSSCYGEKESCIQYEIVENNNNIINTEIKVI